MLLSLYHADYTRANIHTQVCLICAPNHSYITGLREKDWVAPNMLVFSKVRWNICPLCIELDLWNLTNKHSNTTSHSYTNCLGIVLKAIQSRPSAFQPPDPQQWLIHLFQQEGLGDKTHPPYTGEGCVGGGDEAPGCQKVEKWCLGQTALEDF